MEGYFSNMSNDTLARQTELDQRKTKFLDALRATTDDQEYQANGGNLNDGNRVITNNGELTKPMMREINEFKKT